MCRCVYVCVCVCVCVLVCVFVLGLSDYCDSTHYHDSLGLFTIVIVDCLTI